MQLLNNRQLGLLKVVSQYDYKKYGKRMPQEIWDCYDWRTMNSLLYRGLVEMVDIENKTIYGPGLALTESGRSILNNL